MHCNTMLFAICFSTDNRLVLLHCKTINLNHEYFSRHKGNQIKQNWSICLCHTESEREITKKKPLYHYNNIVVFTGKGYPLMVVRLKKASFIVESLCTMHHTLSNVHLHPFLVLYFAHMNSKNSLLKFWNSLHVIWIKCY